MILFFFLVENAVDAHTLCVYNPRLLCRYRQYVKGKSPVYVLDITVPREEVDINVTPDKVSHEDCSSGSHNRVQLLHVL